MSYTTRLNGFVVVKECTVTGRDMVLVVVAGDVSFTFRGTVTMKPDWDMYGVTLKLTAKDGYVRLRHSLTNDLIAEMYVEGVK